MCVVSMVITDQTDRWGRRINWPEPYVWPNTEPAEPRDYAEQQRRLQDWFNSANKPAPPTITKEEVEEFRRLLERAREYDKLHQQPHCESEDKKKLLKQLADILGIDISFVEGF